MSFKHRINTGVKIKIDELKKKLNCNIFFSEKIDFIDGATTIENLVPNKLIFLDEISDQNFKILKHIKSESKYLLIIKSKYKEIFRIPHILSDSPRVTFSNILCYLFGYPDKYFNNCYNSQDIKKKFPEVNIMQGCSINKDTVIGKGSIIFPNVYIGPNCRIGERVIIKPNTTIGAPGFGIISCQSLEHIHLPHIGGVDIQNDVEIGALNTICSGTIHPTIIGEFSKLDDHVHIAHNCTISKGVQIAAHAEISGSVKIGNGCWIGPNSSISDGISIGENSFVGIACNLRRSIQSNKRVAGNPARFI